MARVDHRHDADRIGTQQSTIPLTNFKNSGEVTNTRKKKIQLR